MFDERGLQPYENAKAICALSDQEADSSLLMIDSKDEQEFLENYLFNQSKIVENIWLGAKRDNKTKQFYWDDLTKPPLTFHKWTKLKDDPENECVEMLADGNEKKFWINTPCKKHNLVVCQRMQMWTTGRITKSYIRLKRQYEFKVEQLEITNKTVYNLTNNPVPIGFIYVQFPFQPQPQSIWPNVKWEEVTSKYANYFFRAQGDKTGPFGSNQSETSPHLSSVSNSYYKDSPNSDTSVSCYKGSWSSRIFTGAYYASGSEYLSFFVSNDEVRPQNMAIKIWKRTE